MNSTVPRGNKPDEYKSESDRLRKLEANQVKTWRAMIKRAYRLLDIDRRIRDARKGDEYLDGTKQTRGGHRIYLRYLLPLLEDAHRKTLPSMPIPQVNAKNNKARMFLSKARELIHHFFTDPDSGVWSALDQAQWDDARSGVGYIRATWTTRARPSVQQLPSDEDQIAAEVQRAMDEHETEPKLASTDLHAVHIATHRDYLATLDYLDDRYMPLWEHIKEHEAASQEMIDEQPGLRRVPWYMYVHDPDVPWPQRAWEAEMRSVRVKDLLDAGYRNVNKENCPPETRPGWTDEMPWELATVRIWEIHDRRTGEFLVISADGPEQGRYLFRGKWPYETLDVYYPIIFRPYLPERPYGAATIQACLPILDLLAEIDFYIKRHAQTHAQYKRYWPRGTILDAKVKADINDPNKLDVEVPAEALAGSQERKPPPIPDTLLMFRELLLNELRRQIGSDAQDSGAAFPHKISATESAHRGLARAERRIDRQRIMSEALSWVGRTFLELFRQFATMAVSLQVPDAEPGQNPEVQITADDIPDGLDVYFDIKSTTDEMKAQKLEAASRYVLFRQTMNEFNPTQWRLLNSWFGRILGIERPEQFDDLSKQRGEPTPTTPMGTMPQDNSEYIPPQNTMRNQFE